MKTLKDRLRAAGIDSSSLEPWYQVGGECGFRLTLSSGAEAVWYELRDLVEETGFWPVILGEREEMERVASNAAEKTWGASRTLLQKARARSGESHLEKAFEEFLSCRREDLEYARKSGEENEARALEARLAGADPFRCMPRGEWPEDVRPTHNLFTPYHHRTGEELPEVFIGLAPTQVSWQAPVYLHFGGFNDCPHPDVQGAVLRYWQEKYGAEVVCLQSDTLEMLVARPPETREAALLLAREQFLFCRDVVDQGTQTLERLAAELLEDTTWFFWWD